MFFHQYQFVSAGLLFSRNECELVRRTVDDELFRQPQVGEGRPVVVVEELLDAVEDRSPLGIDGGVGLGGVDPRGGVVPGIIDGGAQAALHRSHELERQQHVPTDQLIRWRPAFDLVDDP